MENVKITRTGKVLQITVDLSKKGTPSASGKTSVIASTKGNVKIDGEGDFIVGLNVYTANK
jgi:hypothetical protein